MLIIGVWSALAVLVPAEVSSVLFLLRNTAAGRCEILTARQMSTSKIAWVGSMFGVSVVEQPSLYHEDEGTDLQDHFLPFHENLRRFCSFKSH